MLTFTLTPRPDSQLFCRLCVADQDEAFPIYLPVVEGLTYSLLPKPGKKLSITSDHFDIREHGVVAGLLARLSSLLILKRRRILSFPRFIIVAHGPKVSRKAFTSVVKLLKNIGHSLDGPLINQFPEILGGWSDRKMLVPYLGADNRKNCTARFAIVVHLYYQDVWPEIVSVLRLVEEPFDLIVTTVADREDLISEVRRDFNDANVFVFPNRGRDIGPFLGLLEGGHLDRYSYICKIHGKKSQDGGRNAMLGNIWRNKLLFDLLAAPGAADAIASHFDANRSLGMLGSEAYRLPNLVCDEKASWGPNRDLVLDLANSMGEPRYTLDFFGGTMFWVRPDALRPLRNMKLAATFPEEQGLVDGALEHAVERLFIASTKRAGFGVESLNAGVSHNQT